MEFKPVSLPDTPEFRVLATEIHQRFGQQIQVSWATPISPQIQLCNQGFAGGIVVSGTHIRLQTKVPVGQLFRLLEYVYDLFRVEEGLIPTKETEEIFESLADILAKQALARVARGLYREYAHRSAQLPYVRGRIDIAASLRHFAKGGTRLECRYSEHTANTWENQIVLAALSVLRFFPFTRSEVERNVRRAFRSFARQVELPADVSWAAWATHAANYHRLNQEYRQLHALCRFFLESLGPEHAEGERLFVPYLISMWRLFEGFVAKWLDEHFTKSGSRIIVSSQPSWSVWTEGGITFRPDLLLLDDEGHRLMVLDTKYKNAEYPSTEDIQQVVAYANHAGVKSAALVYPSEQTNRCVFQSGEIQVRICAFSLSLAPNVAGGLFLEQLGIEYEPKLITSEV